MVAPTTKSIAEEIIDAIKDKTYDSCVSNLTKTHCVNLKNFRRERLPDGTWINTKRFVTKTNCPAPNAMFELFGEFSNQTGPEVRDTMIGWSYDNFRMLEGVFRVALSQRNTSLHAWLNLMADEHTPGDKLTLYVLARMYRRHAYVFTQMFWWTTLLYTVPVTEKELLSQCDVILVYMKEGVFGELERIRSPAPKHDAGVKQHEITATTSESDIHQPQATNTGQSNINPSVAGITQSTPEDELHGNNRLVITESSADILRDHTPAQQPSTSSSLAIVDVVIPESTDDTKHRTKWKQEQGGSKPTLPGIGVFLSKSCTIPLIRCDFDQIKKTVESQKTKPIVVEQSSDKTDPEDTGAQKGTCTEPNQTKSQTSTRPKTVIDYRKFLEDYTDEPPSPPKKKKAVDLK